MGKAGPFSLRQTAFSQINPRLNPPFPTSDELSRSCIDSDPTGPKACHVIARAEGPGKPSLDGLSARKSSVFFNPATLLLRVPGSSPHPAPGPCPSGRPARPTSLGGSRPPSHGIATDALAHSNIGISFSPSPNTTASDRSMPRRPARVASAEPLETLAGMNSKSRACVRTVCTEAGNWLKRGRTHD